MKTTLLNTLTYNELIAIRNKIKYHTYVRDRMMEYIDRADGNYLFVLEDDKVLDQLKSLHLFKVDEAYMFENKTVRLANGFFDYLIVSQETFKRMGPEMSEADFMTARELEYFYKTNCRIISFLEKSTNEKDFIIDFDFYKGKRGEN
jgi:hypothetical protein